MNLFLLLNRRVVFKLESQIFVCFGAKVLKYNSVGLVNSENIFAAHFYS